MDELNSAIVSGPDYLKLPSQPNRWLMEGLVPSGGACLIYGKPKEGKSFLAMQLARAIATGSDWFGFPVKIPGKVVYVQIDTPRSVWQERLAEMAEYGEDFSCLYQADRETLVYPYDILNPEHYSLLRSALEKVRPDCVIIDTIRHTHPLDENDSTAMKNVTAELVKVTQPAAMVIVSHSRKDGEHGLDLMNDNRGSNFLVSAVDAVIRLTAHHVHYTGRAIEESNFKVKKKQLGSKTIIWVPDINPEVGVLEEIMNDDTLPTQQLKAKELVVRLGITEAAAVKRIQRYT